MVQTEADIMVETVSKAWRIPCVVPGVDIGGLCREDQELIAEHGFAKWINGVAKAFGPNPLVVPAKKAPKIRKACINCGDWFRTAKNASFCGSACAAQAARQQAQKSL